MFLHSVKIVKSFCLIIEKIIQDLHPELHSLLVVSTMPHMWSLADLKISRVIWSFTLPYLPCRSSHLGKICPPSQHLLPDLQIFFRELKLKLVVLEQVEKIIRMTDTKAQ